MRTLQDIYQKLLACIKFHAIPDISDSFECKWDSFISKHWLVIWSKTVIVAWCANALS